MGEEVLPPRPCPGRLHLRRGSFICAAREGDLSRRELATDARSEAVAQVERPHRARRRLGPVEEAPVDAVLALGEGLLDLERTTFARVPGELDHPEPRPRLLRLGEQLDVDLRGEDLVPAAHIAPP